MKSSVLSSIAAVGVGVTAFVGGIVFALNLPGSAPVERPAVVIVAAPQHSPSDDQGADDPGQAPADDNQGDTMQPAPAPEPAPAPQAPPAPVQPWDDDDWDEWDDDEWDDDEWDD